MSDPLATPWTIADEVPLSMGFPRQDYWSGLQFPSPGDFLDPGIDLMSPALASRLLTTVPPGEPCERLEWFNFRKCSLIFIKGIYFLNQHRVLILWPWNIWGI